jgi:hypothetical protein
LLLRKEEAEEKDTMEKFASALLPIHLLMMLSSCDKLS